MKQEEFIEKSKKIHGDKYHYDKVRYIDYHTPICIICPEHGEFWQRPDSHLQGKGCKECGKNIISKKLKSNKEDFINKAKRVHGDRYDYSEVEYIDSRTKVCIVCKRCGNKFWVAPINHYSKHNHIGCPCYEVDNRKENFIKKAKRIHGDKYDYSKVEYVDSRTPVTIICPIHGEFNQTPASHLEGKECHKCTGKGAYTYTVTDFIERAKNIHGDKYDYSKVEYINAHTKVCIICPEHGEFWQTPDAHINSARGCIICNSLKNEKSLALFFKNKGISFEQQKKFKWLGKLRLDYYLPEYNIAIEYQGEQHFKPVEHFGGEKRFKSRIERDKRKKKLCEENGVKLLYVSFYKNPTYEVIDTIDKLYEIILNK